MKTNIILVIVISGPVINYYMLLGAAEYNEFYYTIAAGIRHIILYRPSQRLSYMYNICIFMCIITDRNTHE